MLKKDCYHCIKLRLSNHRCSESRQIIEDVHNHLCELWKEDIWMTKSELENDKEEENIEKQLQ